MKFKALFAVSLIVAASIVAQVPPPSNPVPSVTVAWDPPAMPLSALSGYDLYYGTMSGSYNSVQHVAGGTTTNSTIQFVRQTNAVTYFIVCLSVATNGIRSVPSNEITWTVDGATPAPTNERILGGQH